MKQPSVLIADDHYPFRRVVCQLLAPHFEIVGEAADGTQAAQLARTLRPDIVLLDLAMPRQNGIEVARQLADAHVPCVVVFVSVIEDAEIVAAALDAGGRAYVTKARVAADLEPAIQAALAGAQFVSAGIVVS